MPPQQGPLPGGMPMASAPPGGQPQPYRQLKVEDALAYLDQVKMKFEKQPHIYNKVRAACARARLSAREGGARARTAPRARILPARKRDSERGGTFGLWSALHHICPPTHRVPIGARRSSSTS